MIDAGVQETLFFPLLGRARAARTWPTCFRDPWSERAARLAAAAGLDVRNRDMGQAPAAIYALRHLAAVTEIRRYLRTRPTAAVVDLGCGLDRLVGDVGAEGGRRGPWARLRSPDRRRSRVTNLADFCIECNPALSA